MTANELRKNRKATYLFTQHGWDFYSCGSKFYKVLGDIVLSAEKTLLA